MRRPKTTAVFTCLALASGAVPASLAAQSSFEGTIVFLMSKDDGAKPDTMVQTTKGKNARLDGGGREKYSIIFDGDGHRMLMVQPAQKKYFVMSETQVQMMRAQAEAMAKQYSKNADDDEPNMQFSNTGRTETVAGTKCQVWHGTTVEDGKKKEGEACVATGVGFIGLSTEWDNPMLHGGGRQSKMMETYRKLVGPNKGVLKIVEFRDGKSQTMMEAVSINRAPVPAAAFQPPAGYSEVNVAEQMGKMMQGAKKNGTAPSHP